MPEPAPSATHDAPDDVLAATRRLHAARLISPATDVPGTERQSGIRLLSKDLAQMDQRLVHMLDRLGASSDALRGGSPEAAVPRVDGDPVASTLLQRGRSYFDEWRLLLLEEELPATQLADFAASPYVDMLERHHERLALLLDGEGVLLRLLNPQRLGSGTAPPPPGSRLDPLPSGNAVRVAWEGLPALRGVALGGGRLLVREEWEAASPLPQPLR